MQFAGITDLRSFGHVCRGHMRAWRRVLQLRSLAGVNIPSSCRPYRCRSMHFPKLWVAPSVYYAAIHQNTNAVYYSRSLREEIKICYVPLHRAAASTSEAYVLAGGHGKNDSERKNLSKKIAAVAAI